MINIDGGYYYLDIDKINDWIFTNPNDKKTVELETITADIGKQTTKTEKDEKELHSGMRLDLMMSMLNMVYNAGVESGEEGITFSQKLDDLSIGSKIVINSLQAKNILVDKLNKK